MKIVTPQPTIVDGGRIKIHSPNLAGVCTDQRYTITNDLRNGVLDEEFVSSVISLIQGNSNTPTRARKVEFIPRHTYILVPFELAEGRVKTNFPNWRPFSKIIKPMGKPDHRSQRTSLANANALSKRWK